MNTKMETLEQRTLMSAWGTVDDYSLTAGRGASASAITADAAGNIYALGSAPDSTGAMHGILRMKATGASGWTTIADQTGSFSDASDIAINASGDIYVSGGQSVMRMKRSIGETQFSTVAQVSGELKDVAIDPAGNVYAVGDLSVKNSSNVRWLVMKQTGGEGAFTTVDNYAYKSTQPNVAEAVCVIPSGPSAGIYSVGKTGVGLFNSDRLLVRKSTNAGASWTLVDNYQFDPDGGAIALAVSGDSSGNLYVGGVGHDGTVSKRTTTFTHSWIVRKSSNGGASWSLDDAAQMPGVWVGDMTVDSSGKAYVVGSNQDTSGNYHSIVRSNASGAWQTVDDFQLASGQRTVGNGIAADLNGNVFSGSEGVDTAGTYHWIVRSALAAPAPSGVMWFSSVSIGGTSIHRDPALDLTSVNDGILG